MINQSENSKKISTEKKWIKIIIVLFAVVLVISIFFNLTAPEAPVQQNTWNSATPGFKLPRNVKDQLGDPISVTQSEFGIQNNYKSSYPALPNSITVSEDETVKFIQEYIVYDPEHTVDRYTRQFGDPDLVLYAPKYTNVTKAYVFLTEGLAIFAHQYAGTVEIKWYFEPTTEESFLTTYGKDLTQEEPTPEAFQ
ncbi:MAG: hypothetical protein BroJett025_11070 [Patescibacteria group bacterium]|nr:MAG: hypothetical protein BroJett025_11070 [Patescibacteria group bacterium]